MPDALFKIRMREPALNGTNPNWTNVGDFIFELNHIDNTIMSKNIMKAFAGADEMVPLFTIASLK
jgi:hypothetical protein